MKLLDLLRKLGIVRFGAEKAVYRNAKDRPMSFQDDDVFNSKKDVIDLDKKPDQTPPPSSQSK
ncbi:MAG: hypothetical protein WC869_10785 [Phycisphaerae bacterium]|jgi:hypothetical protein